MIRIVNVNPLQPDISGTYLPGDIVLIKCDATDSNFTVMLPDAITAHQITLKIVKTDSSSHWVKHNGTQGQTLSGETVQQLTVQGEMIIYNSDGVNWW